MTNGAGPLCEAGTQQKARGTMRGYRWGKFQGWATFAIGLITWAPAIWSFPGLAKWIAEIAVGVTLMPLGLGLVLKRRFALLLLYAMLPVLTLAFVLLKPPLYEVVFAICWYFIPAIFYYPKRWKDFSRSPAVTPESKSKAVSSCENPDRGPTGGPKQPVSRRGLEKSKRNDSTANAHVQTQFLPDLGKYLASKGTPQKSALIYPTWEIDELAIVGRGQYCTSRVQPVDGNLYCATFDFGRQILDKLLARAPTKTKELIARSLADDPDGVRQLRLPTPINVGVMATLGNLQQGMHETFIPLEIQEVFGDDPTHTMEAIKY